MEASYDPLISVRGRPKIRGEIEQMTARRCIAPPRQDLAAASSPFEAYISCATAPTRTVRRVRGRSIALGPSGASGPGVRAQSEHGF